MKHELDRIEALGETGSVDELTALLASEDWQVRRAAVGAVAARARRVGERLLPEIVDRLVAALRDESNAGLRNAAQEALVRLAPRCGPRLAEEARRSDDDTLILLAPVLGESGSA